MKVIITESQYKKILLEQSNVYTDEAKYKKALNVYNRKMTIHQLWLGLYNERGIWSKNYDNIKGGLNTPTPNMDKLSKLIHTAAIDILILMDDWYRCMNNLPTDDGYTVFTCANVDSVYKELGSPKIDKWNKIPISSLRGGKYTWLPTFKKPNILKPIFKKPEPTKPVQPPKVNKPVEPTKPTTPPTPTSTLDKTKPIDFYFGNRILRAPDYETAHRFAEKLAIRNLNSNQVFVYKDKNNEKWFIGANDKIYFSEDLYNQDPNKNVYVDPVKMGMAVI